jgi:hypothetical protein
MLQKLLDLGKSFPLTTTGFLAFWAKIASVLAALWALTPAKEQLLVSLGNDLALLFAALGTVYSVGKHLVEASRELTMPPPNAAAQPASVGPGGTAASSPAR